MMKYIATFLALFLNWILWSGMFDAFHLSLGVISCVLVTFMSHDLLFSSEKFSSRHLTELTRFIRYIPWLSYQIVSSNIHVAYLALHPGMPIEPSIITFRTRLKKDISLAALANSITLTPGTITVEIREREYYIVHCISKKVADDLLTGEMENRVAHIFEEE